MFSSFKFKVKKQSLLVLGLCFLLVLIPAAGFAWYSSKQIAQGDLSELEIGEAIRREPVQGNGLNVSALQGSNLLLNGSFEPLVYRRQLLAASGTDKSLLVMSSEQGQSSQKAVPLDRFFENAKAEVLSRRGGSQKLKLSSTVRKIHPDHLTEFHPFILPSDTPEGLRWQALKDQDNRVFLAGEKGFYISDLTNSEPLIQRSERKADILDVTSWEENFLFLEAGGHLQTVEVNGDLVETALPEGKGWRALTVGSVEGKRQLLVAGEKGQVLRGDISALIVQKLGREENFTDCVANEAGFILIGEEGLIMRSSDLNEWQVLMEKKLFDWKRMIIKEKAILLLADGGQIGLSLDGGLSFEILEFSKRLAAQPNMEPIVEILAFSDRHFCLLNSKAKGWQSFDQGKTWEAFSLKGLKNLERAFVTDMGMIVVDSPEEGPSYALLGAEIELEDSLEDGYFLSGDLLQLEKNSVLPRTIWNTSEAVPGDWFVSSNGKAIPVTEERSPGGGKAVLELEAIQGQGKADPNLAGLYSGREIEAGRNWSGESIRLAQELTPQSISGMKGQEIFQVEFWARTERDQNATLEIALDGLNLPMDPVKRYLDTRWKKYSLLLITPQSVVEGQELRLCFDFRLNGKVYIDQIELLALDHTGPYRGDLARLGEQKPTILRLGWMPVGSRYLPSEYWLKDSIGTQMMDSDYVEAITSSGFADALSILEKTEANPCIVIRSQVSESELRHLMQYLFGSNFTEYGKVRFEQGNASRWSDLFPQIYLEFEEEGDDLLVDKNRQAFVNWAIDVILSTPEYKEAKNQIVFVDGMDYRGGVLLSSADIHASEFSPAEKIAGVAGLRQLSERRAENFPRDPSRALSGRPEWVKRFPVNSSTVTAAEGMAQILQGLDSHLQMHLVDSEQENRPMSSDLLAFFMESGRSISGMLPLEVKVDQADAKNSESGLIGYAFEDQERLILFAMNLGQETVMFTVGGRDWESAEMRSYDIDGMLLEAIEADRGSIYSLFPGATLVLECGLRP